MKSIEAANELLARQPRQTLGFYPTPLHKLERLSDELGINLYLKRDDLSGINLFGGNKIRKLEYLLGDAIFKNCDTVFTYGATQSNHAMQTTTACRRCGLEPILYLVSIVEPDSEGMRANLLLDYIFGAEVHVVSEHSGEEGAEQLAYQMGEAHAVRLKKEGKRPYIIPIGGASPIGSLGFISGFLELVGQMEAMGKPVDYLFHSTGTGGTLAGLAAGRALLGSNAKIVSVAASPKDPDYENHVSSLANQSLSLIGAEETVEPGDFIVDRNYFAPGYELPNEQGNNAIRRLARTEGILTDTVYSGKAFAGLLDYAESGRLPKGSNVVFLHTGGATALFAEKEIIGDLAEK